MLNLLERLTGRRAERAHKIAMTWAVFVADIVDERTTDADEILTALERLNRTPEELQTAIDNLVRRREWARQACAGVSAEDNYSKLVEQEAAAAAELEKLIESHHKKQLPLQAKLEAARNAISVAADAKRRLQETAGDESRRTAFDAIDAELQTLQAEHQTVLKALHDRQTWVKEVQSRGNSAATEDLRRLSSARDGLKEMQKQDSEFRARLQALQDQRNAAAELLLKPEAL